MLNKKIVFSTSKKKIAPEGNQKLAKEFSLVMVTIKNI